MHEFIHIRWIPWHTRKFKENQTEFGAFDSLQETCECIYVAIVLSNLFSTLRVCAPNNEKHEISMLFIHFASISTS